MTTEAQKEANRKNAEKSTGPKTKEGKAKSSKNAIKHGLTACCNVIDIEDREEFDFFRKEMLDDLYPIGPMQYRLAERIVSLSWRLRRAEIMHDKTMDDLLQKDIDWLYHDMDYYRIHPDLPGDELALGHVAEFDFSHHSVLDRLIKYERRIENSLYKTMRELKKLKKEPISSSTDERRETRYQPREMSDDNYENLPIRMSPKVEEFVSRIREALKKNENMQNEPNSNHRETSDQQQINAGHAGHNQRPTRDQRQATINMQNEPNLNDQTNVTPEITKDYEYALLTGYPEDKPYPPKSNPVKHTDNVIAKRNRGRCEAFYKPGSPLSDRLNKNNK